MKNLLLILATATFPAIAQVPVISSFTPTSGAPDPITDLEITTHDSDFQLSLYPNPFSEQFNVSYSLSRDSNVKITLMDELGQTTKVIVNERKLADPHKLTMTVAESNMNKSGVYIFRMEVDGAQINEKMTKL